MPNGNLVTHRVVNKVNFDNLIYFYTKGDANVSNDEGFVKEENVIGKANTIIKYIGWPTVLINELLRKM